MLSSQNCEMIPMHHHIEHSTAWWGDYYLCKVFIRKKNRLFCNSVFAFRILSAGLPAKNCQGTFFFTFFNLRFFGCRDLSLQAISFFQFLHWLYIFLHLKLNVCQDFSVVNFKIRNRIQSHYHIMQNSR